MSNESMKDIDRTAPHGIRGRMKARPVDALPTPRDFAMSRQAALQTKCCARCGFRLDFTWYTDVARREYEMTALCVDCQDEIYAAADE